MTTVFNMLYKLQACFGVITEAAACVCARVKPIVMRFNKTGYVVECGTTRLPLPVPARGQWKTIKLMLVSALMLLTASNAFALTPPGTLISNTASASYDLGGPVVNINSNTSTVVSTIIKTASSIQLYQYAPVGPGAITEAVPTQYASSGPPGAGYVVSPDPNVTVPGTGIVTLDPNTALDLNLATGFHTGDAVFIVVTDLDQNLDPLTQESIVVVVTSSSGDREELILIETDVNTGIFIGYVQSGGNAVASYDGEISLGENATVSVTYTDQYDAADTTSLSQLSDPYGIVFNSASGDPIDGVTVSILDALGNPATVYGDDGVSIYPSVVVSGSNATDSGGTVYAFPPGGYRFPLLVPGDYQIVLTVPAGFQAPSLAAIADLQVLPGAPFALDPVASYGSVFTLPPGFILRADIPVDQQLSTLVLNKSASKETAGIGDFVQYTLVLQNTDTSSPTTAITLTDTLPAGFRYQQGSARIDNSVAGNPQISSNGRELQFALNALNPGQSVTLNYVTEVSVAAKLGVAVNRAVAADTLGVTSNNAEEGVRIHDELFSNNSFILGRVITGECDKPDTELPGLKDVIIYMEDGSYALTDENGQFHFEGVRPGSHVVQIDLETIPNEMEIIQCEENTRFAGTAYSQFVDLQGGTLWRTNFRVRNKPPVTDTTSMQIKSEISGDSVRYRVEISNGSIPVNNYRLIVNLPDDMVYVEGSSKLDMKEINEPVVNSQSLVYRLGDMGANWKHTLEFNGRMLVKTDSTLESVAFVLLDTDLKRNVRSNPVRNKLKVSDGEIETRKIVYRATFAPMSAVLSDKDKAELKKQIDAFGGVELRVERVVGHSDSSPRRGAKDPVEENRILSQERARNVGQYIAELLGVEPGSIAIEGKGQAEPIDDNGSAAGRANNRRVEIFVNTSKVLHNGKLEVLTPQSDVSQLNIVGLPDTGDKKQRIDAPVQQAQHISMFDEFWIETAVAGLEWLMPGDNHYTSLPAVNIAIKHAPNDNFEMYLNGEVLNPLFYFGTINNKKGTVSRSYWQGVHLVDGVNKFEFVVSDNNGNELKRLSHEVVFAGMPVRATLLKEYSDLSADGIHHPVIALQLFDKDGHFARPGVIGTYEVNSPYLSRQLVDALAENRLAGLEGNDPAYTIGAEGIALIELEPTTESGKLSIKLPLAGRQTVTLDTWLQARARDWVMVGLADGTLGYNSVSGNVQDLETDGVDDNFYLDGKLAFFAKGRVKGEWLLTTAFDSSKKKSEMDNRVNQLIDPDEYYTVYGDASRQQFEASSREKLFIKIEREQFYALFGDYDSALNATELSRYSRRMTGLKSELQGEKFSYNAFAAETLNKFIKDEIQGDGTSGLYRLRGKGLVINSEHVVIETRDRFRSEIIKESRSLTRHIDYSIDYQDGTIFFREPIASKDSNFDPIFIIIDYEVESPVEGDISVGGRAAYKFMDGKVELGASAVHDATFGSETDLVGIDARIRFDDENSVKLEVAGTDGKDASTDLSGSAYLVEYEHNSDDLDGRVYMREQEPEFGVGQQAGSETGTRKYGADGSYRINDAFKLDAEAYHEENLVTMAERDVTAANIIYAKDKHTLSTGARVARDIDGTGKAFDSDLFLLGASTKIMENKLLVRANSEIALGSKDSNPDYPSRYILGVDYFVTPAVDVYVENEWTRGELQDTEISRVGVRTTPWQGAQVNSSLNREIQENGIRTFSTMGLTQNVRFNERWSGDFAFDQTKTMRNPGATPFNVNVPPAQGTVNSDFTAVSVGATYRADTYTLANRLETRNSETEDKVGAVINWERKLIDGVGYAINTQLFDTDRSDGSTGFDGNIRFSLGYRPLTSNWITLNKFEYKLKEDTGLATADTRQRKLIDNLVMNFKPDFENQVSINFGIKHVIDSFDGEEYDGTTVLLGSEYRHDLSKLFDIGVHAHTLNSLNSGINKYSTGVSAGWNIARNVWLSAGYNFAGFDDRDFSAAGYTSHGPYIKFRLKFDQDTAKQIQNWLN